MIFDLCKHTSKLCLTMPLLYDDENPHTAYLSMIIFTKEITIK